jgi:hypothetical protein
MARNRPNRGLFLGQKDRDLAYFMSDTSSEALNKESLILCTPYRCFGSSSTPESLRAVVDAV